MGKKRAKKLFWGAPTLPPLWVAPHPTGSCIPVEYRKKGTFIYHSGFLFAQNCYVGHSWSLKVSLKFKPFCFLNFKCFKPNYSLMIYLRISMM